MLMDSNHKIKIDNIRRYMQISNITSVAEICKYNVYPHSYIYLAKIFSGERNLNDDEERLIYSAINQIRAIKEKQETEKK